MSKGRSRGFLLLAGLSTLLGAALPFLLAGQLSVSDPSPAAQYLLIALQELLLIGVPAVLIALRSGPAVACFRGLWAAPDSYPAGLVSLAAVSFSLGAVLVAGLWITLLQQMGIKVPLEPSLAVARDLPTYLLAFVCAALIPAFSEELMFRGLLLPWLGRRMGERLACLLSALLFSLLHLSLISFAPLLVIGWFLARLRLRYGGLWLPILFHLLYNAVVLLLNALDAQPSPGMILFSFGIFIALCYLSFKKEEVTP
ncbi:MAG: lysostaphin resistance A-like protein [Christensenellales bacterium]